MTSSKLYNKEAFNIANISLAIFILYLEFFLDSPCILVTTQVFPDGGGVKSRDHSGLLALAPGAD